MTPTADWWLGRHLTYHGRALLVYSWTATEIRAWERQDTRCTYRWAPSELWDLVRSGKVEVS